MGCVSFFDEEVSLDNNPRVKCAAQKVEVLDNHSVPEVVVAPVGAEDSELRATFNDWDQFERFIDSLNSLNNRLARAHK